jgi:hypothetical protein
MKSLAALLLALIAVVHYGCDLLAGHYPDPDVARRGLYYTARSIEGAAQYAVITLLAIALWRAKFPGMKAKEPGCLKGAAVLMASATGLTVVVCCWGAVEHLQAAACRISIGISNRVPPVQQLAGICDDLAGVPLYALGLGVVAFIAAVIAAHPWGEKHA